MTTSKSKARKTTPERALVQRVADLEAQVEALESQARRALRLACIATVLALTADEADTLREAVGP